MDYQEMPVIVVSKCLGFDCCRYNGQGYNEEFIERLKKYAQFIPVCPEVGIGLSIPRNPIRLIEKNGNQQLFQLGTEKDVTDSLLRFSQTFLDSLEKCDGFILKGRSPSCGIKDVKIFQGNGKSASYKKGIGIFASEVLKRYPGLPIEEEGRLKNFSIREHYLTKIFTFFKFKNIKEHLDMEKLKEFHENNTLLLMAYNGKELRLLNRILADLIDRNTNLLWDEYESHLQAAFARSPRYTSNIKVLLYAMKILTPSLTASDITFILDTIEKYKLGNLPLSVPSYVIKTHAVRINHHFLLQQSFFQPYPGELVEIRDSGKGLS